MPSGFYLRILHMLQVTDTTTFTADKRRAEVDAWLYETCTQCLQHMVDIVALFYKPVAPILPRIFDLLSNFIRCLPTSHRREFSVGHAVWPWMLSPYAGSAHCAGATAFEDQPSCHDQPFTACIGSLSRWSSNG